MSELYYKDYLGLEKLLSSQEPESLKVKGVEAHDEMLFIIVHQAYELWFKQILHELHSILRLFDQTKLSEADLDICNSRLSRILKIFQMLPEHFDVLETMTPMDFLEFRDLLVPASGFQSVQFRRVEIMLGLRSQDRVAFDHYSFANRLKPNDQKILSDLESRPSLYDLLEKWLDRMPFMKHEGFEFWKSYEASIKNMLDREQKIITDNRALADDVKKHSLAQLDGTRQTFRCLFNEEAYQALISSGQRRLGKKATLSALFIMIYRDLPVLQGPHQILQTIIDIDETLTAWRYRHALLAQRMLGTKVGTGGSSGHQYLKATTDSNRIFKDFMNLPTFLIRRSERPELPKELVKRMQFDYV